MKCLKVIELRKNITSVRFTEVIDNLGDVRRWIDVDVWPEPGINYEVTKEAGNRLYQAFIKAGYEKVWERGPSPIQC